MNWHKHFDERQLKEIKFSQVYAADFSHGTDGHNAKLIVNKLTDLVSSVEVILLSDNDSRIKVYQLNHLLRISEEESGG